MAKTAEQFLNDLAQRDLVPAGTIASLRRQIASAQPPVTAEFLAKMLTDKAMLTSGQAQKILAEGGGAKEPKTARPDDLELLPLGESALLPLDDGGLMPLDDGGLVPLEAAPAALATPAAKTPAKPAVPKTTTRPAAKSAAAQPAALAPLDDLTPLDSSAEVGPLTAGPGADPFADANLAGPLAAAPTTAQQPAPPAKSKRSLGLVLLGAAIGLVIVAAIGGAYFLLPGGTGDAELDLAEADYQAKQYDAAIAKYDAVLADYPHSPRASLARVHRGAARVLAARAASPRDWQGVLAAAKESLPPLGGEPELSQAHAELAPLLTDMAADLCDEAGAARTAEEAAAKLPPAQEALALADDGRLVPGTLRQWQRLEGARESLSRATRVVAAGQAREAAVGTMTSAIVAQDPAAALAQKASLLTDYPELAGERVWRELDQQIADAAATKVQPAEYAMQATATEPRPLIVGSVLFAAPTKSAGTPGPPVLVLAAGSVWGLEAVAGHVVWRRPVGEGPAARPVSVGGAPQSDVLLVDSLRDELLCVAAAGGELRWRHPLASPAAGPPLVLGQQVFLTTRSGQILAIDAKTGAGRLAAQLPQAVRVAPVSDAAGKRLYQLAEDSLLYVLSAADLKCLGALPLGHEPGTITVPPAITAGHFVALENRGAANCALHVLPLDAEGLPQQEVQQLEIPGQAAGPPLVQDGRLAVLADQGRVHMYESATDPADGLKQTAAADAGQSLVARFGLLHDGKLLVVGEGLRQLGPAAEGSLPQTWSALAKDPCLGPPQVVGTTAVAVQRQPNRPGVVVTGVNMADGKTAWQTRLAEPLVAVLPAGDDGQSALAVSASGTIAKLNVADIGASTIHQVAASEAAGAASLLRIASALSLGGLHVLVPAGQTDQLLVLDPNSTAPRPVALPGLLAGAPLVWREGLVVACTSGAVAWIDPASGALKADPLQLPLVPGQRLERCRLAAVGERQEEFTVEGGRGQVTRVGLASDPAPHLAALPASESGAASSPSARSIPSLDVGVPLSGAPLVMGQFAIVAAADGTLIKVSLAGLKEKSAEGAAP